MQMKPGGVRTLPLLHYHTKIFAQCGDLSPARQDMPYAEGLSNAQAIPGNIHPFFPISDPALASYPLKAPLHDCSHTPATLLTLQREVIFRT